MHNTKCVTNAFVAILIEIFFRLFFSNSIFVGWEWMHDQQSFVYWQHVGKSAKYRFRWICIRKLIIMQQQIYILRTIFRCQSHTLKFLISYLLKLHLQVFPYHMWYSFLYFDMPTTICTTLTNQDVCLQDRIFVGSKDFVWITFFRP